MRTIIIISILLVGIFLSGCNLNSKSSNTTQQVNQPVTEKGAIHLADSNYAVISYTKYEFYLFKNAKSATLTKQEVQEIETLTNKSIDEYNKQAGWGKIDKKYKV